MRLEEVNHMEMLEIRNYDINFSPRQGYGMEAHFSVGKQKSVKHKIWPTFKQLINLKSTHERAKPDEGSKRPEAERFRGNKKPNGLLPWKAANHA